MRRKRRSPHFGYGLAVISTLLAAWLQLLLDPQLGGRAAFVTFFLAVVLTACYGGFGPALLAIVLSALAATYLFLPPADSLVPSGAGAWLRVTFFACFGMATALLSEWLRCKSRRVQQEWERFSVTLSNIGDGVIATDEDARRGRSDSTGI